MPDAKISQLPAASLPLAGTEPTVVVQDGESRQAPASAFGGGDPLALPTEYTTTSPSPPTAGTVIYSRSIAGKRLPAFVDPDGMALALQTTLARTNVIRWNPAGGNSTNVPVDGDNNVTTAGTPTGRAFAATNLFTRTRRIGYVSSTTVGQNAVARSGFDRFTTGDGAGLGGFFVVARFGFSALTPDARAFFGVRQNVLPANVEPSTLTQLVGVGRGAADTNLRLFSGGSSAQASVDLGANFPANTVNTDLYELVLFCPSNQTGVVNWRLIRLNTGHVASGQLTGGAAVLPASTVPLVFQAYAFNNATAAAVAIDIASLYMETDT